MYFGSSAGSFREVGESREKLPLNIKKDVFTAVGSRSHPSKETADFFEQLKKEKGNVEVVSMGSSLKICLVAEGLQMYIQGLHLLWNGILLLVMPSQNLLENLLLIWKPIRK